MSLITIQKATMIDSQAHVLEGLGIVRSDYWFSAIDQSWERMQDEMATFVMK
jgi:hypothetical protein